MLPRRSTASGSRSRPAGRKTARVSKTQSFHDCVGTRVRPFPIRDTAGLHLKQGGWHGRSHRHQCLAPCRRACFQFLQEMMPFEADLVTWDVDLLGRATMGNLSGVEPVSSLDRFRVHGPQIFGDAQDRGGLPPKPEQLRMVRVVRGLTSEHCLSEQPFPPQRHQSPGIKVSRMEAPEAHPPSSPAPGIRSRRFSRYVRPSGSTFTPNFMYTFRTLWHSSKQGEGPCESTMSGAASRGGIAKPNAKGGRPIRILVN